MPGAWIERGFVLLGHGVSAISASHFNVRLLFCKVLYAQFLGRGV